MRQIIVNQIIERALADLAFRTNEKERNKEHIRIQSEVSSSPALMNSDVAAEIIRVLTGFRPRVGNTRVYPFEVFFVGGSINKLALCMVSYSGNVYGCSDPKDQYLAWDGCSRLATPEEAEKFLKEVVSNWSDSMVFSWIGTKLGNDYYNRFFIELERKD